MSLLDIGTELRHERYFDSHPRVGGDRQNGYAVTQQHISIRTPAWGGDLAGVPVVDLLQISIRTPAWGVTKIVIVYGRGKSFQFAPPRGG